jgi:SAM-dependent methyltransferase
VSRAASSSGLDRLHGANGAGRAPSALVGDNALAAAAYDAFAPFYDILTEHQDYDWWWSVLLPLAEAAGLSGNRVLDVACGTGKSLGPLIAQGWQAVGIDASEGMLTEARLKLGPEVRLIEHDMRDLPRLGDFDLVCALNDAINYVLDERQLTETFTGFRRNLAPGGVVVFDANTIGTFRGYGALVHQEPGRVLVVEGHSGDDFQEGALMRSDFVVLEQRDGFSWYCHRSPHFQRHHPDEEVRRALRTAGLELAGVYGQASWRLDDTLDELSDEKAVYVARNPRVGNQGGEQA